MLAGALIFVWIQSSHYRFILDDAFISLRYARNLAAGAGLVFNPGLPPVEGYSNFLWVLVEALHVSWTPWPENALLVYDVVFGLAVVIAVWREMVLRGPEAREWAWLAVLLVALHETLHAWMGGGLETTLFMFLTTLGIGSFLRERARGFGTFWSAIPIGLAALARPEAYLVIAVCGASLVAATGRERTGRARAARWALAVSAFCVPHLAFRRLYYGEWVPNTFFAKISGPYFASGIPYVEIFSSAFYGSWVVVAGILLWAAVDVVRGRGDFAADRGVLATIVGGWFVYIAYVGGDHFEFRLLAPTVPLLALLIALTASDAAPRRGRRAEMNGIRGGVFAAIGGIALALRMLWSGQHASFADELFHRLRIPSAAGLARENYGERWRPAGEWLRRFAAPEERISVPAAGIIPWVSRLTTLDTHGLNDRDIARRPITVRGVLAHEKSATWEDVVRFGVTYHVDDLEFRNGLEAFRSEVLKNKSRVLVELANHSWMNVGAVGDPRVLRATLRSRGAIVAAGPDEDADLVAAENARNRQAFEVWCASVEQSRRSRLEASWIPLGG